VDIAGGEMGPTYGGEVDGIHGGGERKDRPAAR
jgi:hypothetical protein